jgi:hypothetical protein
MKQLENLYLVDCGLKAETIQELEKALPATRIESVVRKGYHLEP